MRSMSLLQMLGGVAVAGVVAAGSTAFTAGGVSVAGLGATNAFLGGKVSQAVHGATITGMVLNQAYVSGTINVVKGALLTFDATTPLNAPVAMSTDGSLTNASGNATGYWCTAVDSNHQSTCTVGQNAGTPDTTASGDYYTAVTTVNITVG